MKVKELIDMLEQCSPNARVVFDLCEVPAERLLELDKSGEGLVEFFECEEVIAPTDTVILGDW